MALLCLSIVESHAQCAISMSAEVVQCNDNDDTFNALITVIGTGTGPTFVLGGNGNTYGSFSYGSSPIEIGPFTNDGTIYNFAAIDNTTLTCFGEAEILPYDECIIECDINITDVEFELCDGLARYAKVYIETSSNVGNDFTLLINQVPTASFLYGQEFYTIGPLIGDCETGIGITVFDNADNTCSDFYWQPGPWCCPDECVINDVIVNTYCVNDDIAGIIVDFNYNGNANEQFEILLDSVAVDTSWVFEFPDTFFYNFVGVVPDSINQGFGVKHVAKPNCGFYDDYIITCDNTPPCSFSNIIVNPITCDGPSTYSLGLDFQVESATSIFFDVYGDGIYLGAYQYADLPVVIDNFPERDAEFDIITINDNGNNACSETIEFLGPDCTTAPCMFSNYFIEAHECDDNGMFDMYIQFDVEGQGDEGFIIRGNGIIYDTFQYDQDWYVFGPFEGDCETILEFILIDIEFPDCQAENGFTEPICCPVADCVLSDLTFDDIECDGEAMFFHYDFNYADVTDGSYDIFLEDQLVGTGDFADLGNGSNITVPANDIGIYNITVCVNDNPDCCTSNSFQGPLCSDSLCVISDFFLEPQDCSSDGTFYVDLEFNVINQSASGFTVFGDGNNYGTFEYGESFYTVGPFEGDCQSVYEFVVVDNENQDCTSNFLFIGPICCDIIECQIVDLEVNTVECDDSGNYWVNINFEALGATNDFFDVIVDNEIISFHAIEDLPVEILYPASGNENDVLTVCINDNADCCAITEFPALDCSEQNNECNISNVFAEPYECDENGEFLVDIAFDYENGSNDGFMIVGNGIDYGNFLYGETFYTVGPILADCETILEFVIIDLSDPDCSNFIAFEEPICCEEGEGCQITDLEVEIISCDSTEQVFFASISFDVIDLTTQFFGISGNGEDYGLFGYGQDSYTIGPLEADGTTIYEFIVSDLEFENCSAIVDLGTVSCMTVGTDDELFTPNIIVWQTDDILTINNPDLLNIQALKIFSLEGKYLSGLQSPTTQSNIELQLETELNGIYFLTVLVDNKLHTIKIPLFR